MFARACDWSFLTPMRNSVRLLMRQTSASAGRTSSSISNRYRMSRSVPYIAHSTRSRKLAKKDSSACFPAMENSDDAAAGLRATAPAAAGAGAGVGDGDGVVRQRQDGAVAAPVGGGGGDGGVQRPYGDGERFRVSESVSLVLHGGDITKWSVDGKTDAIVNAANSRMLGGGGVDGAIHRKAGPDLREACREVPEVRPGVRCPVGEARITSGFLLPASRVIHTVGPVYYEYENPAILLGNAYRNSLKAAVEDGIKYICFPAISCGVYSYPVAEAATVSLAVIKEASQGLSEVHFVMFEKDTFDGWMDEASKQFAKM